MHFEFPSIEYAFEYLNAALDAVQLLQSGVADRICLDTFGNAVIAIASDPSEDTIAVVSVALS